MSQFFYCQGSNVNNRAENVHSFSIRLKYRSIDLPKIGKTAGQFSNKDTYLDQAKIRLHTAMYVVHSTAANNQKISEKSKVRGCDGAKLFHLNSIVLQSLTKAIIFELFYNINGYFRVQLTSMNIHPKCHAYLLY